MNTTRAFIGAALALSISVSSASAQSGFGQIPSHSMLGNPGTVQAPPVPVPTGAGVIPALGNPAGSSALSDAWFGTSGSAAGCWARSSSGVWTLNACQGTVGAAYFVDAVQGSDSNDGSSISTAFQTLGKLQTADAALPRNTWYFVQSTASNTTPRVWRVTASLNVPRNGMTLSAIGNGPTLSPSVALPKIDATAIISPSSWTLSSGGCYSTTITLAQGSGNLNGFVNAYENGAVLQRVASTAACASTAASMFVTSDTAGTATLYVHPVGSTNPTTDGNLYEYTSASYGIYGVGRTGTTVNGLWTRGSLDQSGSMQIGNASLIMNSWATDGSKHNMICGEGCTIQDSIARNAYFNSNSSLFVISAENAIGGNATLIRDQAIQDASVPVWLISGIPGVSGFFTHAANGADFTTLLFQNCSSFGMPSGSFAGIAQNITIIGSVGDGTIDLDAFRGAYIHDTTINTSSARALDATTPNLTVSNSTFTTSVGSSGGGYGIIVETEHASVTITDTTVKSGYIPIIDVATTMDAFTSLRNTIVAGTGGNPLFSIPTPAIFNSDYNTYFDVNIVVIGGTSYQFLKGATPLYLTSFPAQDQHSLFYYYPNALPIILTTPSMGGSSVAAGACITTSTTIGGTWQFQFGPQNPPPVYMSPNFVAPGTNYPGPYFTLSYNAVFPGGGVGAPTPNSLNVFICNNDSANAHTPNAATYTASIIQSGLP
jgi:hypothetical protein